MARVHQWAWEGGEEGGEGSERVPPPTLEDNSKEQWREALSLRTSAFSLLLCQHLWVGSGQSTQEEKRAPSETITLRSGAVPWAPPPLDEPPPHPSRIFHGS